MHGGHRTEDEPMAEMNMIPLIDIALTLLIILMVTTAFIQKPGFNLNLPKAAQREGSPETPKDIIVGVERTGVFYMDGQQKTLPEIQSKLKTAYQANNEVRVLVKGDKDVAYGRITDIMNAVREAQIVHVVLPTDPKLDSSASAATQ
jgi:biopolymer transport protein TolR